MMMRKLLLAALLCGVASPALASCPDGMFSLPSGQQGGTFHYVGYETCVIGSGAYIGTEITSVSADWRLPSIAYGPETPVSGEGFFTWVGITNSNILVQLGFFQSFTDTSGTMQCYGWKERYAFENVVQIPGGHPCAPGDHVVATLTCTAHCTSADYMGRTFTASLQDVTQGWTYNIPAGQMDFDGDGFIAHAYIIQELGSSNNPRFSDLNFTNIKINGATAILNPGNAFAMWDTDNNTAQPSQSTGDSFKICFNLGGTFGTCPNTAKLGFDAGRMGAGF